MRTDGRPLRDAVASAIASGSGSPAFSASRNHLLNSANGSLAGVVRIGLQFCHMRELASYMSSPSAERRPEAPPRDFIREIVAQDAESGKHGGEIVTRFPPEPNGRLHIGHAKAICIDFGVALEFGGRCHLRMDDTNPTTESVEYVEAIQRDVRWLGFDWGEHMHYASDYFERYYELGEKLIRLGRAYVCDLPDEVFSEEYRGTIASPGKPSPYRDRPVEESLDLFRRMRAGEFPNGARVLRAKIDMASPNMKMRDPPLMRIKHAH